MKKITTKEAISTRNQDLETWRTEFQLIDLTNKRQLIEWFSKYHYLTTNDHAQIAQKSVSFIRRLKKLAGMIGTVPANIPTNNTVIPTTITVPSDWDNVEWLSKAINSYSIYAIAKACGVSHRTIRRRIKQYALTKVKVSRVKNKCYTKEWCYKHYVQLGWSQARCAHAAGICQQTFANWLNHFCIPVRTAQATLVACRANQLWVKKLYHDLQKQPIVHKVFLRSDHIHVRYHDYFWESYYFGDQPFKSRRPKWSYKITQQDSDISHVPVVLPEYQTDSFESIHDSDGLLKQPHITISRSKLNNASFIEQRLAVHDYCRHITQRGWLWPKYPMHVLQTDMEKLRQFDTTKYVDNEVYSVYARNGSATTPGRKIIEHFFDLSHYAQVFSSPRLVIKILNILLTKSHLKFNVHNMIRVYLSGAAHLPGTHARHMIYDPVVYAILFKRLGLKGSILDLTPGYGNKALAAALNSIIYYTLPFTQITKAIDNGLAHLCGIDHRIWDRNQVDLLLYDNEFQIPNMSIVDNYTSYAKRLMIYVPSHLEQDWGMRYQPNKVIKIKTRWYRASPDCLFIW